VKSFVIDKCPRCGEALRQRTSEQNALLHALLHDISTQKQWAGQWLDLEDWKRLITAGWCRANNEHVRIFPAIDNQGMEILYRRTSRLSKQEMAQLRHILGD
jgi:hypothetical protein